MNKYLALTLIISTISAGAMGQAGGKEYPQPEFSNEVSWYNKDNNTLTRLEKGLSKMDTKTKAGGMGGAENSYSIEGEKSPVRIIAGNNLSFIYATGATDFSSAVSDSMMRANGMDPNMMKGGGMGGDPSNLVTLYAADPSKNVRKVILMKMPGMFGGKKLKSSDKQSFSVRKIKDGYWELVVDKPLKKGEYIFTVAGGAGMGSMDGSTTLFAFGVD
ncbi:MAG: hypothetical protein JNK79_18840 [Chitinophagaceae bacterium]|nr:hypothetical protein [Chitinophagaceae bacterium]